MTDRTLPIANGTDLALSWPRSHRYDRRCPECGVDASREALVRLAYTFEVCSCGQPEYEHLVERLHHRACLGLAPEGETR